MSPGHLGTTAPSSDTERPTYEADVFGFALLWCKEESHRVGEVGLLVPFEMALVGRGRPGLTGFLRFGQHRPGAAPVIEPREWCLRDERISRVQFEATATAVGVDVVVTGGLPTFVNGRTIAKGDLVRLVKDDLVLVKDAALFLVVERQRIMPALAHHTEIHPFGKADSHRMVGEGPAAYALRDEIALAAARRNHVLLLGESGTGKEATAEGIHKLSPRADRVFNAVNAAAIPAGLLASEIFGGIANYPSAGIPAREGVLPAAEGGTAFLDEIGGTSHEMQTALVRAMGEGQYTKIGESRPRKLTTIIVAATSADESVLKLDLRKRFPRTIRLLPLRERKEDIPLVLNHLVLEEARQYPKEMARFLERGADGTMTPRVKVEFVAALVQHPLPGNVRDVYRFLLQALAESRGEWIELPRELEAAEAPVREPRSKAPPSSEAPSTLQPSGRRPKRTREEVAAALDQAGSAQRAALILGVPRRTLRNWMEEYGLREGRAG